MRHGWGAALLLATLAACGNQQAGEADQTAAATETMPSDSGMAPPTGDMAAAAPAAVDTPTYVATAASSDMYEIQSSQLALKESQTSAIRQFAERMVKDHQASTTALQQAVASVPGTTLPAAMLPKHAEMLAALQQAAAGDDAAAFERLYVEQQRTAHAEALDLHRGMAARADAPAELKRFAENTVGVVSGHHETLMAMPAPAGGGTAAAPGSTPVTGAADRATGNSGSNAG